MHFLAHIRQEAEGCDYTIGCGEVAWTFEADSWDDAVARLKLRVIGDTDERPGFWGEKKLKQVFLAQVMRMDEMPIGRWYGEATAERSEIERQKKGAEERQVYERLKQKFEEGNE